MTAAKHAARPHGLGAGRALRAYAGYRARMRADQPIVYPLTWWLTYATVLVTAIIGTW